MSKQENHVYGQFVAVHHALLDCEAWRALSHGARSLYIALRRRAPRGRNEVYLSQRDAEREIGSSRKPIARWFRELEHFGFIVLSSPHCLGVEGKGKAPLWRLTECGKTSKASGKGVFEPGTKDYLRWDGTPFVDPKERGEKTKPWQLRGSQGGDHGDASGGDTSSPPNPISGDHGVAIQRH